MKGNLTKFGREVKKRALLKNVTLSDVAELSGTDIKYLSAILHGHRSGRKYIKRISEVLDIDYGKHIV